jgi:MOSC domain-containing protein YiiM
MKQLARGHETKAGVYGAVLIEGAIRPGDKISLMD